MGWHAPDSSTRCSAPRPYVAHVDSHAHNARRDAGAVFSFCWLQKRSAADHALARLAGKLLVRHLHRGCSVQIGTGMPEELAAVLHSTNVLPHLHTIVESGVLGGIAAPGAFFGAAINPEHMVSSAEAFRRIYDHLDAIIVGALQVWSSTPRA